MNILYHFRTQGRGAEGVHIAGIARAFAERGHVVDFSSPTGADPRRTCGADPFAGADRRTRRWSWLARHCPDTAFELLEMGYNVTSLVRNSRLLKRRRYDLIYERHAFFLCVTAWLARRRRIPLVVEINELVGDERVRRQPTFRRLAERCDRFCLHRADLVTVVSPHLQRRVVALGVPVERTLVLPNAVAAADYAQPADGRGVRRKYGLGDALIVGFVGWLVPWHRLEDLLEAVALAADHDLRLLIVGNGPLRADLESLAAARGIAARVHFAGAVSHESVREHIAAMDVAVIPHSNEYRSPIKLFEYMGQGNAVLAPHTEPIAMVVRHGDNGVLFDPGDMSSFRDGLTRLVSEPETRRRLGEQARTDVLAKHTWDQNAVRILERLQLDGRSCAETQQRNSGVR
jgi:glycosyltransferase involved in cell wall biosynthesis